MDVCKEVIPKNGEAKADKSFGNEVIDQITLQK
jgi:hypothetical protein